MIRVSVTKQSNYPVGVANIKKKLAVFLTKQGIVSNSEISVAIVGEAKMKELGQKYLKDKEIHNVLSFTPTEVKGFVYPPDETLHLGEIVVCYQKAVAEAKSENVLIDERVYELIEHGALHLLGIHHEE
ncbi:MAG TPA: rRNA maturation RNase YbeY [Patescibacteria group bacterium]|nr:rRNA maturation RNase YbeY [Patescibacteria group bacterium]